MSNEPITLPSGRSLIVTIAPIEAANALKKALAAELAGVDVSGMTLAGISLGMDLTKLDGGTLNVWKNVLMTLLASDRVEKAMLVCAQRCTIDGLKVNLQSFEPQETRGDLIVVAWEVIKVNAGAFFESLGLSSFIPAGPTKSDPRSG